MFWRVELSDEGGIFSVEPCESKGTNARRVIYVEAPDKAGACSAAKAWHERYRAQRAAYGRRDREKALTSGKCQICKSRPTRSGRKSCQVCHDRNTKWKRDTANGDRERRQPLPPEEVRRRRSECVAKRRDRLGVFTANSEALINRARAFGDEGPLVQWLIAEQERRAAAWRAANPEPTEEPEPVQEAAE